MPDRSTEEFQLEASSARTGTTAVNTTAYDVSRYTEGAILLSVTAGGGSSPTLTLKLYTKSADGNMWYLHSTLVSALSINTATATPLYIAYPITNFGEIIRIEHQMGGSSPTGTYEIRGVFKN